MTTTVTTASSGPLTANGTTPIPFQFQAISASEIQVTRNGVVADPSTYLVSLNDDETGSITPLAPWGLDTVYISSSPNYQQNTNFQRFGAWYPDQLNKPLDRLTRYIISLKSTIIDSFTNSTAAVATANTAAASAAASAAAVSGALTSKADLVGGLVPTSQLPVFDTTGYRGVVASQAAMLATTASLGNYVIRSDFTPNQVFYLTGSPSTSLASWTQTGSAASVSSVNGQVGTVVLGKADVGLGNVPNLAAADLPVSTAQAAALAAKLGNTAPIVTGQVTVDYDGTKVPGYVLRNAAGVRQGLFYWDDQDDKLKIRHYDVGGSAKDSELSISSSEVGFTGQMIVDFNGSYVPGYVLRDAAGVRQAMLYWDNADDQVKLRRYNALGNGPEGELAISATGVTFNSNALGAGGGGAAYTDEQVRDVINAAFAAGTHSGISVATSDAGESISLTVGATSTPESFGAVGDGVTDDRTALLNAAQSGKIIDGGGRTYAISAQLKPTSFAGFKNVKLKWTSTTAMAVQQFLLFIENLSNWSIDSCEFDLGTVADTGSVNDSSRGGLGINTTSPNVTFNDHIAVRNCRFKGYGNGTRLLVRSCRSGIITGNIVRDSQVAAAVDPTNDCQDGIEVTQSRNMTVANNTVRNLETRIGGTYRNYWSRGFLFTELQSSTVVGNTAYNVDQGFDFSGSIDAVSTNGNMGLTVVGNTAQKVRFYGLKFANCCRHFIVANNTVRDYGMHGFEFSGYSAAGLADVTKNTSHFIVTGNYAIDGTGEYNGNSRGFRISTSNYAGWPRAIRMFGNTVAQPSGSTSLTHGFLSDVVYDGSSNNYNEAFNNKATGFNDKKQDGFARLYARVSGNNDFAVTNATTTALLFTGAEAEDSLGMHSTTTNSERITVPVAGWYRVRAEIQFASNATGARLVYLYKNAAQYGTVFSRNAINGFTTTVVIDTDVLCAAGDYLDLRVYQNSGGTINVNRDSSFFSAEWIRDV